MRFILFFLAACEATTDKAGPTETDSAETGEGEGETADTSSTLIDPDYTLIWAAKSSRDFTGYAVTILEDGSTLVSVPGISTVYRIPAARGFGYLRDMAVSTIAGDGAYFAVHVSTVVIDDVEYALLSDEYAAPGGVTDAGTTYLLDPSALTGDVNASTSATYTFTGIEPGAYTGPVLAGDLDGDDVIDLGLTSASLDAPNVYIFSGGRTPGVYSVAEADQAVAVLPTATAAAYSCQTPAISPDGTMLAVGGGDFADADGSIDFFVLPLVSGAEPIASITETSGWVGAWSAAGTYYAGSRKRDEVQVWPAGDLWTGEDGYGSAIDTLVLADGREIVAVGEQGTGTIYVYEDGANLLTIPLSEDLGLAWCGASLDLRLVDGVSLLAAGCWQEVVGTGSGALLYALTL